MEDFGIGFSVPDHPGSSQLQARIQAMLERESFALLMPQRPVPEPWWRRERIRLHLASQRYVPVEQGDAPRTIRIQRIQRLILPAEPSQQYGRQE